MTGHGYLIPNECYNRPADFTGTCNERSFALATSFCLPDDTNEVWWDVPLFVDLDHNSSTFDLQLCAACWQPEVTLFCGGQLKVGSPMVNNHIKVHEPWSAPNATIEAINTYMERKESYFWLGEVIKALFTEDYAHASLRNVQIIQLRDQHNSGTIGVCADPTGSRKYLERLSGQVLELFEKIEPAFETAHTPGCWKYIRPDQTLLTYTQDVRLATVITSQRVPPGVGLKLCDVSYATMEQMVEEMESANRDFLLTFQTQPWTRENILDCEHGIVLGCMTESVLVEGPFVEKASGDARNLYSTIENVQVQYWPTL